jgi:hypothetical protein
VLPFPRQGSIGERDAIFIFHFSFFNYFRWLFTEPPPARAASHGHLNDFVAGIRTKFFDQRFPQVGPFGQILAEDDIDVVLLLGSRTKRFRQLRSRGGVPLEPLETALQKRGKLLTQLRPWGHEVKN